MCGSWVAWQPTAPAGCSAPLGCYIRLSAATAILWELDTDGTRSLFGIRGAGGTVTRRRRRLTCDSRRRPLGWLATVQSCSAEPMAAACCGRSLVLMLIVGSFRAAQAGMPGGPRISRP